MIDDSPLFHHLMEAQLKGQPLEIHTAMDGETGIAKAQFLRPEVILLDIDLPGMDGFEVLRRLKAAEVTSEIPVILLTATSEEASKTKGISLGATTYVTKPFLPSALSVQIQRVLREIRQTVIDQRRDQLTGLWDRTDLARNVEKAVAFAILNGSPLSLAILDIDGLRSFNLKNGAVAGDSLLRKTADLLKLTVAENRNIYTNGSGRFFLLLPGHTRSAAVRLAQKLHSDAGALSIRSSAGQAFGRFSLGVADLSVADSGELLEKTEMALRQAKLNSGGCVSVARAPRAKLARV